MVYNEQRYKGFSLIEMLIYVAILGIMLGVTVQILLSFSGVYSTFVLDRRIHSAAATSLERLVREIRSAESVDVADSTFDTHPGRLTLQIPVAGSGNIERTFAISNGQIALFENGVLQGALTGDRVEVIGLIFKRITNGTLEGIRTELTLQATRREVIRSATFYSFTVLRASMP